MLPKRPGEAYTWSSFQQSAPGTGGGGDAHIWQHLISIWRELLGWGAAGEDSRAEPRGSERHPALSEHASLRSLRERPGTKTSIRKVALVALPLPRVSLGRFPNLRVITLCIQALVFGKAIIINGWTRSYL